MEHVMENLFRRRKPNGKFSYYMGFRCKCGKWYHTDRYNPQNSCDSCSPKGVRGRPVGYKMTDSGKANIAAGRTGKVHDKATRRKISVSVLEAFRLGLCKKPVGFKENEYDSTNIWR